MSIGAELPNKTAALNEMRPALGSPLSSALREPGPHETDAEGGRHVQSLARGGRVGQVSSGDRAEGGETDEGKMPVKAVKMLVPRGREASSTGRRGGTARRDQRGAGG